MNLTGDAGESDPLFPDRKSGVWGQTDSGYGIAGTAVTGNGVQGGSISGFGVVGTSDKSTGVIGLSSEETAVFGQTAALESYGLHGSNTTKNGAGVRGDAMGSLATGVLGAVDQGAGVTGLSAQGIGVIGSSSTGYGVEGISDGVGLAAVAGTSSAGYGVSGYSTDDSRAGVLGISDGGSGVEGISANVGVFATNSLTNHSAWLGNRHTAADFEGDVWVTGELHKSGGGFRIDHPLRPANDYLTHSFLEGAERKNLYDGRAQLGSDGRIAVSLPEWLVALNDDFRYQLTAVGGPCPNLCISREVTEGSFEIAGDVPGAHVCWQITGVRKDRWAKANPLTVEASKPPRERGLFITPALFGDREHSVFQGRRGDRSTSAANKEAIRGRLQLLRSAVQRWVTPSRSKD